MEHVIIVDNALDNLFIFIPCYKSHDKNVHFTVIGNNNIVASVLGVFVPP